MSFVLKQALEFNKLTVGIAAAGLAYVGSFFAAEVPSTPVPSFLLRLITTIGLGLFAASVLCGIFVMGRATKLKVSTENDTVDDPLIKMWGFWHTTTLILGLLVAALLMLNKIWKWVV